MEVILLTPLDILIHYWPELLLVCGIIAWWFSQGHTWWETRSWRTQAVAQASAHGITVEHYLAMVRGLIQNATGLPDPLPPALIRRAICDATYRETLIDQSNNLPIRRFWRPTTTPQASLVPPELVLAQMCRRMLRPPTSRDQDDAIRWALAWQLAAAANPTPTVEEVRRIIWDRRYRAAVLNTVDPSSETLLKPRQRPQSATVSR